MSLRYFGLMLPFAAALMLPSAGMAQSAAPIEPISVPVDLNAPRPDASITPLDRLTISVFREPDLSADDVPVDESGRIALPLIGSMIAAGKSTDVLAAEISAKLKEYVRQPEVAVLVKQAASRRVTVTGSVMQPGVYPIEGRLTLLQAVALARGPSQVAALDQALIFRQRNGQRVAARYNLDTIAKGKAPDPEVISGDTVAVGSSKMKTAWRDIITSLHSFNIFNVIP
jgi:polysaccharide export outer membrane protein